MAAVGDQNDEVFKVFEMHFNQTIRLEHLIRSGSQIQPIHADLRVPHDPTRTSYEEAMENPDGPEPKPFDFYIGQNDLINPKLSSGKNYFAITRGSCVHSGNLSRVFLPSYTFPKNFACCVFHV